MTSESESNLEKQRHEETMSKFDSIIDIVTPKTEPKEMARADFEALSFAAQDAAITRGVNIRDETPEEVETRAAQQRAAAVAAGATLREDWDRMSFAEREKVRWVVD